MWISNCKKICCQNYYTVLQNYAHIGLKQNLLRSITLDISTRLLDNAAFVCIHVVEDFRLNGRQQHCARNYERKCKYGQNL